MNNVLSGRIHSRAWLGLAGATLVATTLASLGCNSRTTATSQKPADRVASASDSVADELRPKSRQSINESKVLFEQGELDQAIRKLTNALNELPQSRSRVGDSDDVRSFKSEIYLVRGQAYLSKGLPQIAIADFDDAIRLGENGLDEKTYVLRARANADLYRLSHAVADCDRAIRLNPDNGEAFLVRGRALEANGQTTRAEKSFLEAENLGLVFQRSFKPVVPPAPVFLAEAERFIESGAPGVASEILEKAILDGDRSSETLGLLAKALFQLREFAHAIDASTRAIELDPQNADAYRIRGLSNLRRRKFDQSITDLNAAIAFDASLAEQLEPGLSEARSKGGIDPVIRTSVAAQIGKSVAAETFVASTPEQSERWLLELISKQKSSDQIEQFKKLLAETPETEFDTLDWLADFLMIDYEVASIKAIRNYLNQTSTDVSSLEKRLWESVESPVAAANSGVNLFSDLAEYAIENEYLALLQKSIDSEVCIIKFDHVHQSIGRENADCLRIILPHANLLRRDPPKLLGYCIEKDRKDHAMLILEKFEGSLTWELVEFLNVAE